MIWLPDGVKISKIRLFVLTGSTNVIDRRTDGHRMTAIAALMHSIVRQIRDSGPISGFAAYRSTSLSTVRVATCEKQSRDEWQQASSTHRGVRRLLFAQDDDEVFMTGSTLYAGDEGRSTPWS